jgi:hypothetical protein
MEHLRERTYEQLLECPDPPKEVGQATLDSSARLLAFHATLRYPGRMVAVRATR